MKNAMGQVIGIISVDDSKSGRAPSAVTVRPLEIFANLISEMLQRRILAKKIKESEEKYRELITNIKVGIFRMDPQGQILEANPNLVKMMEEEGEHWAKNHPDDPSVRVNEAFDIAQRLYVTKLEHACNLLVEGKINVDEWNKEVKDAGKGDPGNRQHRMVVRKEARPLGRRTWK